MGALPDHTVCPECGGYFLYRCPGPNDEPPGRFECSTCGRPRPENAEPAVEVVQPADVTPPADPEPAPRPAAAGRRANR
jgi:hypothetical protein